MIKINLLAEKKQVKKMAPTAASGEGGGIGRNVLLVAMLLIGLSVATGWWWSLKGELAEWDHKHMEADQELERLTEIRKKGDAYKLHKELLARKIDLITELKKRQTVPVHILDQVSKQLPDFLWLESMDANNNQINIKGKATSYNAVSRFYSNLTDSGLFDEIALGRTYEVNEGVAFSLTCSYVIPADAVPADDEAQGV